VEHRLGLTTITGLFAIITTLSLCEERCLGQSANVRHSSYDISYLARLVLGDLVLSVLSAVLALAVSASGLGNVDLKNIICQPHCSIQSQVS
jgi:hypothetical protein